MFQHFFFHQTNLTTDNTQKIRQAQGGELSGTKKFSNKINPYVETKKNKKIQTVYLCAFFKGQMASNLAELHLFLKQATKNQH